MGIRTRQSQVRSLPNSYLSTISITDSHHMPAVIPARIGKKKSKDNQAILATSHYTRTFLSRDHHGPELPDLEREAPAPGCEPGLAVAVGVYLAEDVEEDFVEEDVIAENVEVYLGATVDNVAFGTHKALCHS